MVTKKDLVIAILATFCLTATLFIILPSRSAERDPWADVSGLTVGEPDGKINFRDISYEITHFNQDVSNMTRDVNVTNWPRRTDVGILTSFNLTWTNFDSISLTRGNLLSTDGYSRLYLVIAVTNMSTEGRWDANPAEGFVNQLEWRVPTPVFWDAYDTLERFDETESPSKVKIGYWVFGVPSAHMSENVEAIEVKGPYVIVSYNFIGLSNIALSGWMTVYVYYYLRNE